MKRQKVTKPIERKTNDAPKSLHVFMMKKKKLLSQLSRIKSTQRQKHKNEKKTVCYCI